MFRIMFAIFIILHALVHLLYFGQSARYFELQPGMTWPDGSWIFARFLSPVRARALANAMLILVAVTFAAAGVGILVEQSWWRPVLLVSAVLSSLVFILFWDGAPNHLDNKGGLAIIINLALLVALVWFNWPDFNF